jgi:NarL family two-component system response regulator YdfI
LIRVTVVSPNPALRIGLRELLRNFPEISVVGEAADFDELDILKEETDVLLLASVSDLPEMGEVFPAILLLTDSLEDAQILAKNPSGIWGILPMSASEEELEAALQALGEGLWVGAPALLRGLMREPNRIELVNGDELPESLTARETEVLQLIAQGLANKQVALKLNISEHTVKFHLSSLYAKLNVSSRTEAIRIGLSLGLISL